MSNFSLWYDTLQAGVFLALHHTITCYGYGWPEVVIIREGWERREKWLKGCNEGRDLRCCQVGGVRNETEW